MELALAVGSMFGIGGGAAAGGLTWAAANAGVAASSGLTLGGVLSGAAAVVGTGATVAGMIAQGTLTAYSAAAAMRQGEAAMHEAKIEEINAAAQASREKIASEDEATRINRLLAATVGDQAMAYARGGVIVSSGTPSQARREAQRTANEDLSISRSNAGAKVQSWRQRALAALARGDNAMRAASMEGRAAWANYGVDILNRGIPGLF